MTGRAGVVALAVGAAVLGAAVLGAAAVALSSPWPGALLIRSMFERDATKKAVALEKHAPTGIRRIADQRYGSPGANTTFDVYYPEHTTTALPTIVWLHGGAWISGSKNDTVPYFMLLAEAGFTVVGVDYSLGPGHRYPTAIRQVNAALASLVDNAALYRIDPERIVLAGDSAGAQLASQLATIATNPSYADTVRLRPAIEPARLRGVILHCGIYDAHRLAAANEAIGLGISVALWAYTGVRSGTSSTVLEEMSTARHATSAFPPAFISGGNGDPLTGSQSRPFAERLERLGVPVTTLFWPDDLEPALRHEHQFVLDTPQGRRALEETIAFAIAVTGD